MAKKDELKRVYITTPIYYSSGQVHIGNSYTTIACDTLARFYRLMAYDVHFLTGMDEHGQKIEAAATIAKMRPVDFVNELAQKTKELWKNLAITNDDFIQTSEERHTRIVQKIFERLLESDDIYLGTYTGLYCISCETFFKKTQLKEEGICPDCGKKVQLISEETYFLRLTKYQQRLLDFIEANPDFIQPQTRKNEVVSFIKSGLEDLSVSRTSFTWGIPVLSNPQHVIYVWIDALVNYLSALGYLSDHDQLFQKYWLNSDCIYHVVGKDILRFHAIYWPIMLMALDIPINFKLLVHGWILVKDGRMAKSRGNAVYPMDLVNRYGLDATRYYLTKELSPGNDGIFSYERFIERYNSDLANDLGNLLSRTLAMIKKYRAGVIPKYNKYITPYDEEIKELSQKIIKEFIDDFSNFRLPTGIQKVWTLINRANKYIDETSPWKLAKNDDDKKQLDSVLYHLAEILRIVSVLIESFLVESHLIIKDALGLVDHHPLLTDLSFGFDFVNPVKELANPLFKRFDLTEELAFQEQNNNDNNQAENKEDKVKLISFDQFSQIEFKIGEIISAIKHPNATKLLISRVRIGDETRQIVSGIAEYYQADELIGKKVLVVTNLAPVKIRGELSEGMLLCADDGRELELLEAKKLPHGSVIK